MRRYRKESKKVAGVQNFKEKGDARKTPKLRLFPKEKEIHVMARRGIKKGKSFPLEKKAFDREKNCEGESSPGPAPKIIGSEIRGRGYESQLKVGESEGEKKEYWRELRADFDRGIISLFAVSEKGPDCEGERSS